MGMYPGTAGGGTGGFGAGGGKLAKTGGFTGGAGILVCAICGGGGVETTGAGFSTGGTMRGGMLVCGEGVIGGLTGYCVISFLCDGVAEMM